MQLRAWVRRLAIAVVAALTATAAANAAWAPTGLGNGKAGSKTMTASTGSVPTATVSSHAVTLTWTASQFADGVNVPGYVVKRYDGVTNALQTTLTSCSGVVGATTCTENAVPTGTWKYTVTPAAGAWRGVEGAKSANVLVLL